LTHYTLPNLLTREPLVPEFLQHAASPAALCEAVGSLLDDTERRIEIEESFSALRQDLKRGADERAAAAVLKIAAERKR